MYNIQKDELLDTEQKTKEFGLYVCIYTSGVCCLPSGIMCPSSFSIVSFYLYFFFKRYSEVAGGVHRPDGFQPNT
jgi:hypothetical protein